MRKPQLSAGAVLAIAGVTLLLTVVFWHQILAGVAAVFALRLAWLRIRRHLIDTRSPRRGKSLWEIAAAGVGGYLVGRRNHDALASAVSSGAEIQIHVKPKPSRYRPRV